MELNGKNIEVVKTLMIDTVAYQHMDEFIEIFGDGVSQEEINKILRPMAMFLLSKLIGEEDEYGVIQNATGTYGHKILINAYREWFTNNDEDVKNTIEMIKSKRGNNDVE